MAANNLRFVAPRRHKTGLHKQLIVKNGHFLSFNGDRVKGEVAFQVVRVVKGTVQTSSLFLTHGMNKLLLIAALAVAAYFALAQDSGTPVPREDADRPGVSLVTPGSNDAALENAFANRLSNQQLAGQGTVVKMLADDTNGSRHQRFIVRLNSGQTLLVSHNIDLAKRIDSLRVGDTVAFYGEYEWNPKGGVIHWTHHDPQGRHPAGWIKHDGQTYQ